MNKYLIIIGLILILFSIPVSALSYKDGFVADWNFDGSNGLLTDVNTDVNHTAIIDGVVDVNFIPLQTNAKMGTSYRFNATDANIFDSTGVFQSQHFSISMWFQFTDPGVDVLFSSMADRTINQYAGYMISTGFSGPGVLEWRMGDIDGVPASETVMILPYPVNDGLWHHLVVTYDGSTKRMYLDGNLDGIGQPSALVYNATNFVTIGGGRINGSYNGKFDGNLDEFAFWDRVLTSSEINNLYNSGDGLPYPFSSADTSSSFDVTPPSVGQTTVSGFTTYGSFLQGSGILIGGGSIDAPDYNYGGNFRVTRQDQNNIADICTTSDGSMVFAVVSDGGDILDSNDYGATWGTTRPTGHLWRHYLSVACSDSGEYVIVGEDYNALTTTGVYISSDYGRTWTKKVFSPFLYTATSIATSSNGMYIVVAGTANMGGPGYMYLSSDYGVTWGPIGTARLWTDVAMSKDGKYIWGVVSQGYIYISSDYGVTWDTITSGGNRPWTSISMDSTGKYGVATSYFTNPAIVYTSNYGVLWNTSPNPPSYTSYGSSISYDGLNTIVPVLTGKIMASHNYGKDYNLYNDLNYWSKAAISNDKYAYISQGMSGNLYGRIYKQVRDVRGVDTTTCEYTDNNGVSWQSADWNVDKCTKSGVSLSSGVSYVFNFRVRDYTGNYGYGTATRAYTLAEGSAITFYVQDSTGIGIEGADLNIFRISSGVRTFYTKVTSDVTGTAIVFMNAGDIYGIDVYRNGVLVKITDNLLISTSPIYIIVPAESGGIIIPDVNQIYISWNPSIDYLYSDVTQLVQTISSKNIKDFNILIYQYVDFNSNNKSIKYSAAGACNKNCTVTTLLAGFTVTTDRPFYVDLNLGLDNNYSTRYITTHKYIKGPSLLDNIRNIRSDFGCSLDTSLPCGIGIIVSIIITIIALGGIIMATGYTGPQAIIIIALAALGILTYVGWFYWIAYFIVVLASVLYVGRGVIS